MLPYTGQTIPHTELPPANPESPTATEWETYRREVGRLLAEGLEGKTVLIHGNDVISPFDTWDEARSEGVRRFGLGPYLVQTVRANEPLIRLPIWLQLWHGSRSQFKRTA